VGVVVDATVAEGVAVAVGATLSADTVVKIATADTGLAVGSFFLPPPVDATGAEVAPTEWVPMVTPPRTVSVVLNAPLPLA